MTHAKKDKINASTDNITVKPAHYTPGTDNPLEEVSASQNLSVDDTIEFGRLDPRHFRSEQDNDIESTHPDGDDPVMRHTSDRGASDPEVHSHHSSNK